ncbi:MAG: hypothetical protein VX951_00795 [Planctomycetota bacterium]|nr:hypothetical protein [Planctomycetota bacterium]
MKNWLPILTGLLAAAFYLLTLQRGYYDDGIRFEGMLGAGDLAYIHVLYLPVVLGLRDLLSSVGVDSEQALKITAALSGGFAVGITCRVALDTFIYPAKAIAVALLLAGLFGFWFHSTATELHAFHAAFASCLLLGLIRFVDAPERATPGLYLLLFFGAATTPASHASGVATGLPILCALCFAGGARRRLLMVIGAGLAVWGGVYYYLYELFEGYSTAQSDKLPRLLENPGLLPGQIQAVAAELLLYSVPASTLIPAGFRVLCQKVPKQGMLCLSWILGWAILALPVGDRAYGSNFVATMPAQALLAIAALHGLAVSPWRMILTALLAFLPLPVFWYLGELAAVIGSLGSALVLWVLVRPAIARPRWPFLLHVVLFAVSAVVMAPIIQRDPIRDQIAAVAALVDPDATVVLLEKSPNKHLIWARYFPGAQEPNARVCNPFFVDYLVPEKVAPTLDEYRRRVAAQAARQGRVFLVRESGDGGSPSRYEAEVDTFLGDLRREYSTHPTALPGLFELKKRQP